MKIEAMGAFKLEIRCPSTVNGVGVDPDPDWSFESLLSELNSLETTLKSSSPLPLTKTHSRGFSNGNKSLKGAFVMRISDDEMEDTDSEGDEEDRTRNLVVAKRFNYDDLYLGGSDDSDSEFDLDMRSYLMDEVGSVQSSLFELSQEHQLGVKEEIRNKISELEMELMRESEKSIYAFTRVDKYRDARRESDKKFDTQYQRKIAEALDNHLTSIQRDHELKSQIEERRIRSDAAHEEAKRKEKALQEERLRQERARIEAETKRKADEERMATLEAERRAAEKKAAEAAEKQAAAAAAVSQQDAAKQQAIASLANQNVSSQGPASNGINKSQAAGTTIRAAESALSTEKKRLEKLKALDEQNQSLKLSSNMDFSSHERHFARLIKQIRGTKDNVSTKSNELMKLLMKPSCPQSISLAAFATLPKKVASQAEIPDGAVFACAYVIVVVTSQVPQLMDLVLAEFHRGCIYTVPKHITYSKLSYESKEVYQKTIGYQEQDMNVESTADYLKRLECYMRLYGALVQTEIQGLQNSHGLNEGWAWLARFLNNLPANVYTAVALKAFLRMAGFRLYKKYKAQFGKILNIIATDFVEALKKRQDAGLNATVTEIESYIQDKMFLQEPEGARLQEGELLSHYIGWA